MHIPEVLCNALKANSQTGSRRHTHLQIVLAFEADESESIDYILLLELVGFLASPRPLSLPLALRGSRGHGRIRIVPASGPVVHHMILFFLWGGPLLRLALRARGFWPLFRCRAGAHLAAIHGVFSATSPRILTKSRPSDAANTVRNLMIIQKVILVSQRWNSAMNCTNSSQRQLGCSNGGKYNMAASQSKFPAPCLFIRQ